MKRIIRSWITPIAVVGALAGCVTVTPNFSARPDFWEHKQAVIGVALADFPKPTAYKGGSQGLLDIAINNANAGPLEEHLNSLDISKVADISDRIAGYLTAKGFRVKQIKEPVKIGELKDLEKDKSSAPNSPHSSRDFTPLKAKYGIDKLVLITVTQVGTVRNYYGFFPIGAPAGITSMLGQAINLADNSLEWNQVITQTVPSADPNWDQPPQYPGLTKAVYTALDQSRNLLYNQFVQ
jgi:hypothetical protein